MRSGPQCVQHLCAASNNCSSEVEFIFWLDIFSTVFFYFYFFVVADFLFSIIFKYISSLWDFFCSFPHYSASSAPTPSRQEALFPFLTVLFHLFSILTSISLNLSLCLLTVTLQHAVTVQPADPLSLPLLWVNMTHDSIIHLSFCHYYTLWTPLHLSPNLFS